MPSLDADLKGPANDDAALMAETLIWRAAGRRPADMTVLTSGARGSCPRAWPAPRNRPAAASWHALEAMARRGAARRYGGVLFLGPWRPGPRCQSGDEGGGYDEIFLPADAARWKGAIGMVENALTG
jgi:hypothetical protein